MQHIAESPDTLVKANINLKDDAVPPTLKARARQLSNTVYGGEGSFILESALEAEDIMGPQWLGV